MRQFTSEQIQERFETLPTDLQEAVSSPEVNEIIQEIGRKHDLHIDQVGELVDAIGLVMLGLVPAKDFVRTFSEESGVEQKTAEQIADDINKEVFSQIRSSIQKMEDESQIKQNEKNKEAAISSIEKAGGFSIEPQTPTISPTPIVEGNKEETLAHIEAPVKKIPQNVVSTHTEPLMDRLLRTSVTQPEQKIVQKPSIVAPAPPANLPVAPENAPVPPPRQENSKPKIDPYRELPQ
jgi:hypothetical protein